MGVALVPGASAIEAAVRMLRAARRGDTVLRSVLVPIVFTTILAGALLWTLARAVRVRQEAELATLLGGVGLLLILLVGSAGFGLLHHRSERARRLARALALEGMALRQSEERFRSMVLNTSDVILILQEEATIEYQSPSSERVWGYAVERLKRQSIFAMIHPEDQEVARSLFQQALQSPRLSMAAEFRVKLADESWCYVEAVATNLLRDPRVNGVILTCRDITERKDFEQMLSYQAFHDALTDLPNRTLFADRLERALVRAVRHDQPVAVLFLDLDNFKLVNDSLGHPVGDRLLTAVSERILSTLRQEDTIARLGGDEFAVLVEDISGVEDATRLAERIHRRLVTPFSIDGHEVFVSTSIGIVISSPDYDRPDDLLRDADLAMYRAKAAGAARSEVFDHSMNARVTERLALETSLRRAIERNEFRVYYQPLVDLRAGGISGFEALVRWEHPTRGLVPPSEFIPMAEETGLIVEIGEWVLREACQQAQAWQAAVGPNRPLLLSVNLSPRQLQSPGLVDTVAAVLRETDFEPTRLKLEITESVMMHDVELTIARLLELKRLRIGLAIDDFGTGYSSLSYLRKFPADVLKIDRSFVARLCGDPEDRAIVRSIIGLAGDLGMVVVGEGIETAEQLAELRTLGCAYGQGYYFDPPLPAHVAESRLLASRSERTVACPAL